MTELYEIESKYRPLELNDYEAEFFDTHITPLNLSMKDPLDLS